MASSTGYYDSASYERQMRLMGKWAWYLPRWAHRVLPEVTFGHA